MKTKANGEKNGYECFLSLADMEFNQDEETPFSFYTNYRSRVIENLKPKGSVFKWSNNMVLKTKETLSPSFEDHILLTALLLMHRKLPALIKEEFKQKKTNKKVFLMDIVGDILASVPKILQKIQTGINSHRNSSDNLKNESDLFENNYVDIKQEKRFDDNYSDGNDDYEMDLDDPDVNIEPDVLMNESFDSLEREEDIDDLKVEDICENDPDYIPDKKDLEEAKKTNVKTKSKPNLKISKEDILKLEEWMEDEEFATAQNNLKNDINNCDNFEDPKILWFKYHGFNPDIILFKNQHKQAKMTCPVCTRPRFWHTNTEYTNGPKLFFNHLRNHKFKNSRFQCPCAKSVDGYTNKVHHVKSHHWGWVTCPHCPILVENQIHLTFHIAKKHKEKERKNFVCTLCPRPKKYYAITYKDHMDKHVLGQIINKDEEKCKLCIITYKNAAHKGYHDYVEHGGKMLGCTRQISPENTRDLCYFICSTQTEMDNHILESHPNNLEDTKTPRKEFICDICGYISKNSSTLNTHKSSHNSEKVPCPICAKEYLISNLNRHIKRGHAEPEECTICGVKVKKLRAHMTQHIPADKMKHKCQHCDKGFMEIGRLRIHMMNVHLKEKPYNCRYGCELAYNDTSNRNQHEKRRHGQLFTVAVKQNLTESND